MCACYPLWKMKMVNFLLDKGANVNVRGARKFTPLHFASIVPEQNLAIIQRLIDKWSNYFRIG